MTKYFVAGVYIGIFVRTETAYVNRATRKRKKLKKLGMSYVKLQLNDNGTPK